MILMGYLAGYIVLVLAAAAIVAGVEVLNQYCPHGPPRLRRPVAIPVADRTRLRQNRP
jgi:hypothetical protein